MYVFSGTFQVLYDSEGESTKMVTVSNQEWTNFVAEVRSRLDVIDANIASTRELSDIQHQQLRQDFLELKEELTGVDPSSMANRVRSLEDSRTKMNGVQLGISGAFSVVTAGISWLLGHPGVHLTWHQVTDKLSALAASILSTFGRRS